jgi:hypothetical protein
MDTIRGLLACNKLTLVNIGRHLSGKALIKNKIKKCDRLVGNHHLYKERWMIYKALTTSLISPYSRPLVLVDWSGVTHCGAFHMIRACIPVEGRTLTIYEEVYPENEKDSPKANKIFLRNLAKVLPIGCCPIIVTDAGFRNPWFKEIQEMGWDFIGRVRNKTHVRKVAQNRWESCKDLYKKATLKARYLGEYWLAKSNPLCCKMFLIKCRRKYREKKNLRGQKVRCSSSLKHAKRNKEPWLIATSISTISAKKIIKIYKLRMSIEQGFRDIKNYRHGFCFRETRSATVERLSILLLIGALATFIVCIYGHACQLLKAQYQYQTNSIKHRKVLSWFFLGVFSIKQNRNFTQRIILDALSNKIVIGVHYYG